MIGLVGESGGQRVGVNIRVPVFAGPMEQYLFPGNAIVSELMVAYSNIC